MIRKQKMKSRPPRVSDASYPRPTNMGDLFKNTGRPPPGPENRYRQLTVTRWSAVCTLRNFCDPQKLSTSDPAPGYTRDLGPGCDPGPRGLGSQVPDMTPGVPGTLGSWGFDLTPRSGPGYRPESHLPHYVGCNRSKATVIMPNKIANHRKCPGRHPKRSPHEHRRECL